MGYYSMCQRNGPLKKFLENNFSLAPFSLPKVHLVSLVMRTSSSPLNHLVIRLRSFCSSREVLPYPDLHPDTSVRLILLHKIIPVRGSRIRMWTSLDRICFFLSISCLSRKILTSPTPLCGIYVSIFYFSSKTF